MVKNILLIPCCSLFFNAVLCHQIWQSVSVSNFEVPALNLCPEHVYPNQSLFYHISRVFSVPTGQVCILLASILYQKHCDSRNWPMNLIESTNFYSINFIVAECVSYYLTEFNQFTGQKQTSVIVKMLADFIKFQHFTV